MTTALSDRTIDLVKATVPALEAAGSAVTDRMYQILFETDEVRELFNQAHQGAGGSQSKALTAAILAYARNIDNLGALRSRVERIVQKHVGLNIQPRHYHFVADALLQAIEDVLGDAASLEILEAWGEAYWLLADLLMAQEARLYSRLAAAPGGWNGLREFKVDSTVQESDVIRSFVLVPDDGGAVMRQRPGQYLTFFLDIPGAGRLTRNYSISCAPNDDHYRISVKREAAPGKPRGVASNWLHDHCRPGTSLKVAPPAGEFFLDEKDDGPAVLVSGGVGLTPLMSMLETVVGSGSRRPIWYVHGAENGRVHAMGAHARELAAQGPEVTVRTFYNAPAPGDVVGRDYDEPGLITADWLERNTPLEEAAYYLCGPRPFLRAVAGGLARKGVALDRVRYEFFGPADELLA
jgi:nitric oxide dioxygenase